MPAVDVVVPCYNYGRYLQSCVGSLLSQEGVDVRVLIIDDTSTDDSPQIGAAIAASDPRVEFRHHAKNMGHIATYNEGLIGWCKSEYSLLISADDLITPGCLWRATQVLERHPEASMAYGQAQIFYDEDYPVLQPVPADFEFRIAPGAQFIERCLTVGNPVPTACAVVRTRIQQAVGGYDAKLPFSADMDMWMQFCAHGPIGIIKPIQALYRKHSTAMSRNYYERYNRDRRELIQTGDTISARLKHQFPDLPRLNDAMHLRLALQSCWDAGQAVEDGNREQLAACMAFAQEAYPDIRRTPAWMKLTVKRMLGQRLLRALKRNEKPATPAEDPELYSRVFGWWT
jgi:glycosyltransferase involved in cell wall biosynthesis